MSRYDHSLSERLMQIVTETLSDEMDVLISTDDEVYNKVSELAKLCVEKFYAEEYLSDEEADEETNEETEYHDMDSFILGED